MLIRLSLRTMISLPVALAQLLIASKQVPLVRVPSPTTATTLASFPSLSRAKAKPSATEMATPAWPATAASAGDSWGEGKPESPLKRRREGKESARPVSIFHAYDWWPTSQTMRSELGSKTSARAMASSTAPREEARCPPFSRTVSRMRSRISDAVKRCPPSGGCGRRSRIGRHLGRVRKSRAKGRQ